MARRGEKLSEHILWAAKEVFLEMGFERASMDMVAARAETSKRSLYAYYPSKEKLFLAVIELVRGMFLRGLKMPGDYSSDPHEAIVIFCGRYLEILLHERAIKMCRVSIAEASRFPDGAAHFFDALFAEVQRRLSVYIIESYNLSQQLADETAQSLLGQVLYPRFTRALLAMDILVPDIDPNMADPDFDIEPVRKAVDRIVIFEKAQG